MWAFLKSERGNQIHTYALIVGLLSFALVGSLTNLGQQAAISYDPDQEFAPEDRDTTPVVGPKEQLRVTEVVFPSDGTYRPGDVLTFDITFNGQVTVEDPLTLDVLIGADANPQRFAATLRGLPRTDDSFTFDLNVPTINDLDGIDMVALLGIGPSGIVDAEGGERDVYPVLPLQGDEGDNIFISVEPVITAFTFPDDGTYGRGDTLTFDIETNIPVTVAQTLELVLQVGTDDFEQEVRVGTPQRNGSAFSFVWTIPADFRADDPDGLTFQAQVQGLATDGAGTGLDRTLPADSDALRGILIDVPPMVLTLNLPPDGYYRPGETMTFEVISNTTMQVTSPLEMTIFMGEDVQVPYVLTSAATSGQRFPFEFQVPLDLAEPDYDGLRMDVSLGGSATVEAGGDPVDLTLPVPSTAPSGVFIHLPPVVTEVIVPPPDTYTSDELLDFTVVYNSDVVLAGDHSITLAIGENDVGEESYAATALDPIGTRARQFTYRFRINSGPDDDGIRVASAMSVTPGGLVDRAGDPVFPDLGDLDAETSGILIDLGALRVVSITPPPDGLYTYTPQDWTYLFFTVHFNQPIEVTGYPRLVLDIGRDGYATSFIAKPSASAMTFQALITPPLNGTVDVRTTMLWWGGAYLTTLDNQIYRYGKVRVVDPETQLAFKYPGIRIDTRAPSVVSVSSPAQTFEVGQQVPFTVTFDEPVSLSGGTASLAFAMDTGTSAPKAEVSGPLGLSTALTLTYTVQPGDGDLTGLEITDLANALQVSGGTLRDEVGIDAKLGLPGASVSQTLVDGSGPTGFLVGAE